MAAKLRILSMNANSVTGKLNLIKCYSETYKPDILCICETKICANFADNELLGDEFTLWRKDRAQGAGGVLIAMRNNINAKVVDNYSGPGESITIKLQIHDKIVFNIVDRKSTRLNSSHTVISYAVFCLKKKKKNT